MRNPFFHTPEHPDAAREGAGGVPQPAAPRPGRPFSRRAALLLAAGTLGVGVGVGAAIGPAPSASFAGVSPSLLAHLPELLATIAGSDHGGSSAAQPTAAGGGPAGAEAQAASARRRRRRRRRRAAAAGAGASEAATSTTSSEAEASSPSSASKPAAKAKKLPAVTSVWLIELGGESFAEAQGEPAAAPYITASALHEGALLSGWSALQGAAFASEAALLAPVAAGATPPLVHSLVQPPCPEGAAGASCSTPAGALAAADTFLRETLAQITTSAAYHEHGLVVITFASVGVAAQAGLPAGASSATLTDVPPAGVLVLSPFAKAGSHPSLHFNATSPSQSLQALLG